MVTPLRAWHLPSEHTSCTPMHTEALLPSPTSTAPPAPAAAFPPPHSSSPHTVLSLEHTLPAHQSCSGSQHQLQSLPAPRSLPHPVPSSSAPKRVGSCLPQKEHALASPGRPWWQGSLLPSPTPTSPLPQENTCFPRLLVTPSLLEKQPKAPTAWAAPPQHLARGRKEGRTVGSFP